MQIQVLEADYLDTSRTGTYGARAGNVIVQGVEFDQLGKRVGYWLFDHHPGATLQIGVNPTSRFIPESEVIHIFVDDRPGQVRGISWFAPAVVTLKDFDDFADAQLMRQKIAALFSAFVEDPAASPTALGEQSTTDAKQETLEPGMISYLPAGKKVTFSNPPTIGEYASFTTTTLRQIARALGIPYESLSGDYSQVNYSSFRAARQAYWGNVDEWRWDLMIPLFCDGVWVWFAEAAMTAGLLQATPEVEWTPPADFVLEPDREGLAIQRLVRTGAMTPSEMVRQRGKDPAKHFAEYAADLKTLKALDIELDIVVADVSQAGQAQSVPSAGGAPPTPSS